MPYTDNPVADFMKHDARQQALLDRLPKCENCGHPIQQDTVAFIGGCFYCDDCIRNDLRVDVEYE